MIFRKRDASFYANKRSQIRAKMKEIRKAKAETAKYLTDPKYRKLEAKYNKLGQKWWRLHAQSSIFVDGPWGLDITDMNIGMNDIRYHGWASTLEEKEEAKRQSIPGTAEYNSLRVLEDTSVKITTFRPKNFQHPVSGRFDLIFTARDGVLDIGTWASEEDRRILTEEFEALKNDN